MVDRLETSVLRNTNRLSDDEALFRSLYRGLSRAEFEAFTRRLCEAGELPREPFQSSRFDAPGSNS